MKIVEVPMNILTVPQGWATVCAISADLDVSVGLPKLFNDTYQISERISAPERGHAYSIGNTFAMVVKDSSYDKPNEDDFDKALEELANLCVIDGVTRLAIPKLCCGRNGFAWRPTKKKIIAAFKSTNVFIMVCN